MNLSFPLLRSASVVAFSFVLSQSVVFAETLESQLLIQVSDLSKLSSTPKTLLDVRDEKAYASGHIPGALRVDGTAWKNATATPSGLSDSSFWEKELGGLGIDGSQLIIVYGTVPTDYARVWWLLKYVGCRDVRILNGGWSAYEASGGKKTTEPTQVAPTKFVPKFQADRFATGDELLKIGVQQKACQIVDNRTVGEYSGKEARGGRGGHIPGAVNSDWQEYMSKDGTFLPMTELRAKVIASGIDLNRPAATHCQGGGRSSVGAFVLELLSGKPAKNYYRSWGEWGAREDLPVEK